MASGTGGVVSQNHFMLGAIDRWLLESVAGLRQAPDSVGWSAVEIAPVLLPGVESVGTEFDSPMGRMTVSWRRTAGPVEVSVELPGAVDARVTLPEGAVLVT